MPQAQDDINGADAMKQAPTPGPLSGDDVKLLVKGDLVADGDLIGVLKGRAEAGDGGGKSGDDDRMIDKTIQRLRRKGRIFFTREGRDVVWRAQSEARV